MGGQHVLYLDHDLSAYKSLMDFNGESWRKKRYTAGVLRSEQSTVKGGAEGLQSSRLHRHGPRGFSVRGF